MMKNKALKTLYVFNGIFVFAAGLLGPLYAVFVETIDNDIMSISLSWAALLISTTFFMMIVEKYGDLIKEKEYLLMGGFLVRAIVWFSFPFTSTLGFLIFLQFLLGIGEALGSPAWSALFAEHLDKNKHIKEYADWHIISNVARAMAVILGGLVVKFLGFDVLFYLMGSLALVSFFGVLVKPRKLL